MSLQLQHTYVKERRRFGRPVKFFLRSEVLADYQPVKSEGKRFLTKWTMDKSTEKRAQFAVATVNTERMEYVSRGMSHVEGGYSKDIDATDEEQTLRYKKKLQRSEEHRIEMTRNLEVQEVDLISRRSCLKFYLCITVDEESGDAECSC